MIIAQVLRSPEMACSIRDFRPGDEQAFHDLNESWIREYFVWEPKDEELLSHPNENILEKGGRILMAECDEQIAGCCALLPIGPTEYELGKMAVKSSKRGAGIGRRLLEAAIVAARECGASRIYLESSHKLPAARHLYESCGFQHLPKERVVRSPYVRSDTYMELLLTP